MRLLPVEHKPQQGKTDCLAACAQMGLAYLNITASQNVLKQLFDTTSIGAPLSHIRRLERYGVNVALQEGDEFALQRAIDQNIPPVIFVRTNQLDYWKEDVQHAIVVVGYDEAHFLLNDPAFPDAPKRVLTDEVILAWDEFDYLYALITRK